MRLDGHNAPRMSPISQIGLSKPGWKEIADGDIQGAGYSGQAEERLTTSVRYPMTKPRPVAHQYGHSSKGMSERYAVQLLSESRVSRGVGCAGWDGVVTGW